MKLKASLHIHTSEDPLDGPLIDYSFRRLAEVAVANGFKVLALTCHHHFAYSQALAQAARQKQLLLLPAIELQLNEGRRQPHVLVLNCARDIAKVKTLAELRIYKQHHPEILVIAAHPNSDWWFSLGSQLLAANADVFDLLEHTWFYGRWFNANRAVKRWAKALHKPLVATADLHELTYFNQDYTEIEATGLNPEAVLAALRQGKFKNFSRPKPVGRRFLFLAKFLFLRRFILTVRRWRGKTLA